MLATIPKLSDKKVCFSRCSVGISDHFIMVKSDHNQMVGVFARPSIESSHDGTSPPELPLLGSIDLKPHRIEREYESDDDDSTEDDSDEDETDEKYDFDEGVKKEEKDFMKKLGSGHFESSYDYDQHYEYSRTHLFGLGKSHVVTGSSILSYYGVETRGGKVHSREDVLCSGKLQT